MSSIATAVVADAQSETPRRAQLFILVAGEASGDLLGAQLIADLRMRFPTARFAGVGGAKMQQAGLELWYPSGRLAVMGLVEVVKHLPGLLALRRELCARIVNLRPDCFIGIDAPDFNLGLERTLKFAGVTTFHYVSPSVWAWRESRASKIGRSASAVLCLFPMEPAIYARHNVPAYFVGHPLADAFAMVPDKQAARRALGVDPDIRVLTILPGSRLGEIARLGDDFLRAARLLRDEFPQLHIMVPMANAACRERFDSLLQKFALTDAAFVASIRVIDGNSHAAMIAADAILLASGTAALEAMLAKRPMVVAYRLAPLTYWLVHALGLLRTSVFALPNILSNSHVVPELMQDACAPHAIAATLAPMLRARALDDPTLRTFEILHQSLLVDAADGAAAMIERALAAAARIDGT